MDKLEKIKILCQERIKIAELFTSPERKDYSQGAVDVCKDIIRAIESED